MIRTAQMIVLLVALLLAIQSAYSDQSVLCKETSEECKQLAVEILKRDLETHVDKLVRTKHGTSFMCDPTEDVLSANSCVARENMAVSTTRSKFLKSVRFSNGAVLKDPFKEFDELFDEVCGFGQYYSELFGGCRGIDPPELTKTCPCGTVAKTAPNGHVRCDPEVCLYRGVPEPCLDTCNLPKMEILEKEMSDGNEILLPLMQDKDIQLEAAIVLEETYKQRLN